MGIHSTRRPNRGIRALFAACPWVALKAFYFNESPAGFLTLGKNSLCPENTIQNFLVPTPTPLTLIFNTESSSPTSQFSVSGFPLQGQRGSQYEVEHSWVRVTQEATTYLHTSLLQHLFLSQRHQLLTQKLLVQGRSPSAHTKASQHSFLPPQECLSHPNYT